MAGERAAPAPQSAPHRTAFSLRTQLVAALLAVALLATVVVGWIAYRTARDSIVRQAMATVGVVADARRQALLQRISARQERAASFLSVARRSYVRNGATQREALRSALEEFRQTVGASAVRVTLRGAGAMAVGDGGEALASLPPLRPGQPARFVSDARGRYYVVYAATAGGDAMTATYPMEEVDVIFRNRYGLGQSGETFLADRRGYFLTPSRYPSTSGISHPIAARPMQRCLAGRDGEVADPDYRGAAVIHGYRHVPEIGGGCIMAHVDQGEAFAPARRLRNQMMGLGAGMLLRAGALSLALAGTVTRPIARLTQRARALQAGDFRTEVPIEGPAEVRSFAETFAGMAGALDESRAALVRARDEAQAAGQLFRSLLDVAPDGIVIVESGGRIRMANIQSEHLFGYTRDELIGQPIETLVPERFREKHLGYRTGYMAEPRTRPMGVGLDLYALRKDGSEVPVEISLAPLQTPEGLLVTAIVRDISRRKEVDDELKQRTAALEAANKELEAFSYSVSHDLRAPLRSIDGFSQALLEDYTDKLDEGGQDYLRRVRAASQRMGHLIDDILKLSRVIRAEVRREEIDLSGLAREVAGELREQQPERPVEWTIHENVTAFADAGLMRAVLQNLLGNAWKFTGKQPHPRIEFGTTRQEDGTCVYFVRDNGAGFDMAYAQKLFGAFQRLHAESEFAGTGIGLATVQRIIHRHGGRIWAESAVGQGATFSFTLPA